MQSGLAVERSLLLCALMATDVGATAVELVGRFTKLGVGLAEDHASRLLRELAALELAEAMPGAPDEGDRYVPTARGLGLAASLEASLAVDAELAGLERLRTQLLGVLGHELRTPLTAIRTSVGLLRDPGVRPSGGETERLLTNIAESAERMQHLVADVLEIARFRTGSVRLQSRLFDAATLAEGVFLEMGPVIAQKRQHLRLEIQARPTVYGDRLLLRQVLVKLLSNANRFAPPGADIRLRLDTHNEDVIWSVGDRGPGISAEDLPRLFERFFAADRPLVEPSGPGLGLPISLSIARAHGGRSRSRRRQGLGARSGFASPSGVRLGLILESPGDR
jgi:signal transduction histidine kinase